MRTYFPVFTPDFQTRGSRSAASAFVKFTEPAPGAAGAVTGKTADFLRTAPRILSPSLRCYRGKLLRNGASGAAAQGQTHTNTSSTPAQGLRCPQDVAFPGTGRTAVAQPGERGNGAIKP